MTTETPAWISQLFSTIDRMDAEKFASFLTEQGSFTFGNMPAVSGREAIKESVEGFFSTIKGLSHQLTGTWVQDGTVICEGTVTYTRKDDKQVSIPFATLFGMDGPLIEKYRIYIDMAPLFQE